ncbi:MAG: hypothetical protein COZ46_02485 [Verrucomicrobia bacterium CG_4_10_14_3_um_filter_43_23]|nr:MAG: hypothetical protein COX01_02640 [Verrucomicrobia bacterium CG22_combo_CG10-13_8_21_14_all_43_17]PIX58711.1 MAG: hypothetical protein COZ46_02485 [Verrucomicrobia bacterium CG_4_10_14_3_um_filter_43_23]PIY62172.1 MAG: hypothetical protein COY94_02840 [Verrucomicrobia bacterium CG_4_10_14_0_8_um_filter_43_34]PJA44618.1 MAG: hypothetical protein CO175_02070 [Verrucomicrobia bacterium CG_4_9_14_3_um_filter_43_20]
MKNIIKTLSVVALVGTSGLFAQDQAATNGTTTNETTAKTLMSDVSLKANVAFESETVYRGSKRAQASIQPTVELGYPVFGAKLYTGVWSVMPAGSAVNNAAKEVNPYFGVTYEVTDMFTADAGFIYYWQTNTINAAPTFINHHTNRQREIYLGVSADVLLNPSIYMFYNFDLRQFVIQPSIAYSYDLGEFGFDGFSADFGASLGWLTADAYNGDQRGGAVKHKNGYVYWTLKADLTYHMNENAAMSVGPRYAGNNDGFNSASTRALTGGYNANALGNRKNMFWWGASVNVKF